MNISKLYSHLLNPNLEEHQLIKNIKIISNLYTKKRENLHLFSWNEDNVSAYTLFYMITNMPKLKFLYQQLPKHIRNDLAISTLIDFGSGPGTYSWQHLEFFPQAKNIVQVEKNLYMKKQASKIHKEFFTLSKIKQVSLVESIEDSTLLFGNSANELSPDEIIQTITKANSKNLIFIEPGTKETFSKLNGVRIKLIKLGYNFVYPCHSQSRCSLEDENEKNQDNWCHQVLNIRHADEVERWAQILKLNRSVMPTSIWFLSKSSYILDKDATLFRFLNESKHSFLWQVCMQEAGVNRLKKVEISKQVMSKVEIKQFKKASTGLAINFKILKKINDDCIRVQLIQMTD